MPNAILSPSCTVSGSALTWARREPLLCFIRLWVKLLLDVSYSTSQLLFIRFSLNRSVLTLSLIGVHLNAVAERVLKPRWPGWTGRPLKNRG